ncbi:MAG: hypothetical protein NC410_01225 [Oscillibacter sp.]|nr:hypothetical protein [Oscillibacter sp.]
MIFEYSLWWIIPIAVVSAWVARFKFKKISKLPDVPFGINFFISFLRFLILFFLLFLLLKPALQLVRTVKEKPLLIIAQDNSASLLNGKDSLYFRNGYSASLREKLASLQDRFTLEWVTFGKNVQKSDELTFSEHYTNLSGLFDYIDNHYVTRKPEGVLLMSDGKYNTGMNPRYGIHAYPVYTVVLGDTTEVSDVYIQEVICDKFNFLHTLFPLKVEVAALGHKGKTLKCVLKENGKNIDSRELTVDRDNYLQEVVFSVEAKQKGVVRYTVELETDFEERNRENNRVAIYVNILDNSGKIAIYYSAPHPDIAAITEAVNAAGIYKCTAYDFSHDPSDLQCNLFILHNPRPEDMNYQKIVKMAAQRQIAIWYVLTNRQSIMDLSRYGKAYNVSVNSNMNEYASPAYNRSFPYFEFTEQESAGFAEYPPLIVPFGQINTQAGKNLFLQKIKNTVTENGIMSFYDNSQAKQAYFWGEGLWKWRLFSYKENGNHELFNTWIHKTVNYLISHRSNDRLVHDIKALYDETEDAIVNVELYNESYELVNTPDVRLNLQYGEKEFSYLLNRNGEKYRINLGNLPAGEYRYALSVDLKGEKFGKKGVFYVQTQNPEINDVVADVRLMEEIAEHSGGICRFYSDMDEIIIRMAEEGHFVPVYKTEMKYIDLGELKWAGILLLILLCMEWGLLKYYVS